jgi:hypothetical protein
MTSRLADLFRDDKIVRKIQLNLPYLFQIAELESSRAGKTGMEVGSVREKILIALLIYYFGKENVETKLPITEPEMDCKLFGVPVSIKTITGLGGVKIIWTVDAQKAKEFREAYTPKCDILLALIRWEGRGGLYYIPLEVQQQVFATMGRNHYIHLPKPGTNPRGVEFEKEALLNLLRAKNTQTIEIEWRKRDIPFDPYKRWVDYWKEDQPKNQQTQLKSF